MEEIKFRARNANLPKCWIYGYFAKQHGTCYIVNDQGMNLVRAGTECQYIGLKDKNGREIYGRDICKMIILGGEEALNPPEALRVIIEWKNAAWGFRHLFPGLVHEDDRDWCAFNKEDGEMWDADYFEVIGNFHDSPELSKR